MLINPLSTDARCASGGGARQ